MGFLTLLEVVAIPMLQILLIGSLRAFIASKYLNLLNPESRRYLNKLVFDVFAPSLIFASLAKTVDLQDIITWCFMPLNIELIFFIGGMLRWFVVKIFKPEPYLEGIIMSTCSAGNIGNLMLVVVPAICNEDDSPFGNPNSCNSVALSYASFSMAIGGFYIWSYTYHLLRSSAIRYKAIQDAEETLRKPNNDLDTNSESHLLKADYEDEKSVQVLSTKAIEEDMEKQVVVVAQSSGKAGEERSSWGKETGFLHQIKEELKAPPTIAAILGFIFGCVPWLKNLLVGRTAPLRVVQDSIKLLGDGAIPCSTLIVGANRIQGLHSAKLKPLIILGVILVRYVILPVIGMGVIKVAGDLGFLSPDPLYQYALMLQFTLPPAMSIGTMTQLFDVGQEECSVIYIWTYLVAAFALTMLSTVYMWVLS